jgi:hypothetical protein
LTAATKSNTVRAPMRQESLAWGSRTAVAVVAALVGIGLTMAACGEEESEESQGTDLTALRCPLEPAGKVGGVEQFEPADDSFDTSELVGMEIHDAAAQADEHGCTVIVSLKDGKGVPVPIETDPTAVYVYTEDDVVTEIEGVGGGL